MKNLLARLIKPSTVKAVEGEPRAGPWWLPVTGGWLASDVGQYWNWWQMGFDPVSIKSSVMVEACVSKYAQAIAQCPGDHWRKRTNGGRERIENTAAARIMRKPNDYQSMSDFQLNAVRSLFLEGNAFALALRNDRFEINSLHLMHPKHCAVRVAETGEVFYSLGGNEVIERRLASIGESSLALVPQRDVLHIKLHTPRHPLIGESPINAAALSILSSGAVSAQSYQFFMNQARPSIVLTTDEKINQEQAEALRSVWNRQSQGLAAGGTPILGWGLKPHPISLSPEATQLIQLLQHNNQDIALVFNVPLQILGIGGTPFSSTEALMSSWLAGSLGFALNHIEESFGQLFGLRGYPDEYVEFDTKALLRSAYRDRIDAGAKGIQGGVMTPNEARDLEGLPPVEGGDQVYVQQQMVPLAQATELSQLRLEQAKRPPKPAPQKPAAPPVEAPKQQNQFTQDEVEASAKFFKQGKRNGSRSNLAA